MLEHDGEGRLGLIGDAPGEHLIEHDAQRIDIRTMIYAPALALLRRHVCRGAYANAGGRELLRSLYHPRQSKVSQEHPRAAIHQDVGRLDVAVNDALSMRIVQRLCRLCHDLDRLLQRQGLSRREVLERARIDVLYRDIADLSLLPIVIDGQDVGMVQPAYGFGLTDKALAEPIFVRKVRREHLNRHVAFKGGLERLEHRCHPSLAQLPDDTVLSERLADQVMHFALLERHTRERPMEALPM